MGGGCMELGQRWQELVRSWSCVERACGTGFVWTGEGKRRGSFSEECLLVMVSVSPWLSAACAWHESCDDRGIIVTEHM